MKEFPGDGAKLHNYEAFIAVIEEGNLTRAAKRLRRSLQSVSRSLTALEAQVGVVLVRRTTRTAEPTEAGLAFHRRLNAAFREIALAETDLSDSSETLRGTLRIAGSAVFVGAYVLPAVRDFSLLHPGWDPPSIPRRECVRSRQRPRDHAGRAGRHGHRGRSLLPRARSGRGWVA